ncbi:segregation/condensation protein A [Candidatus Micrarchaeota archaeon]|nr:segregation/condensation protein A [Candidatus Micrarchaeota archaeon]
MQLQTFAHFETMVATPTWKEVLMDLVSSHSIDPWDIDIIELADVFTKKVKDIEKVNFSVQANVILAAAILLRYKSEYLKMLSYQTEMTEFPVEESQIDSSQIPELSFSSRIPPKRQITLNELLSEMEKIIKYDQMERVTIPRGSIVETIDSQFRSHEF